MAAVLAIDAGMTAGYAALGRGAARSGSRAIRGGARQMGIAGRHFDSVVRELILEFRPKVIVFATPFVGSRGGRPVQPDSIRPLMSFLTIIEMICAELRLRCIEVDEPAARRAFLVKVPRRSAAIKLAVMEACRSRGWPCTDDHAGDALCIAAWAFEQLEPSASHQITPLFARAKGAKRGKRA